MRAEIIGQRDDILTVKLFDKLDVQTAKENRYNGRYFANIELFQLDDITSEQRKHYFALCGDITDYTGTPVEAVDSYLKYNFMIDESLDEFPSLAVGQMKKSTASKLLEFVINFCITNDIPFRKQQFYLTTDTSKMLFALTMKRLCVVCGRPHSDIHHVDAIGMGADRKNHNHSQHEFLALCREHHNESHTLGQQSFMNKYHIKPIKLDRSHLKELGVH